MPIPNLDRLLGQIAYPGDTPRESNVLRAWLKDHGAFYDRIEFNVGLGFGQAPSDGENEKFENLMRKWTQLRADAIVYNGDAAMIIEVKGRGLPNAMGQLLAYRTAYMVMYPERPAPTMHLVCESIGDDIVALMDAFYITVAQVEPLEPHEAV